MIAAIARRGSGANQPASAPISSAEPLSRPQRPADGDGDHPGLGADARRSRSLIAAPRPWSGIGATAMPGAAPGFGLVQPFEQPGRRLYQVARSAQRGIAADRAEADQPFPGLGRLGVQAERLGRRVMAGELARRFHLAARVQGEAEVDRAGAEQPGAAAGQRDDRRFRPCPVRPPSTISGMRPPRLARRAPRWSGCAAAGIGPGAARGRAAAASSACIAGCAGARRATVGRPAVTREAIGASSRSGRTSVSGPGQ